MGIDMTGARKFTVMSLNTCKLSEVDHRDLSYNLKKHSVFIPVSVIS
jgi:hypothetical protein